MKEILEVARKPGSGGGDSDPPAEGRAFETAVGRNRQVVNHCAFSKPGSKPGTAPHRSKHRAKSHGASNHMKTKKEKFRW